MSQENRRRAFKPLRLRLSEIQDPEVRSDLEMKFEGVQVQRELAVAAARQSAIADRNRQIATAEAEIGFIKLMQEAGKHLDPINREPVWAAFRDNGEVIFECPFSEGDMRNAMKVQARAARAGSQAGRRERRGRPLPRRRRRAGGINRAITECSAGRPGLLGERGF